MQHAFLLHDLSRYSNTLTYMSIEHQLNEHYISTEFDLFSVIVFILYKYKQ